MTTVCPITPGLTGRRRTFAADIALAPAGRSPIPDAGACMDPAWLIAEPAEYDEYDLGPLKTGKEAAVFLVERVTPDGRSCLLAHKRYRPAT